MAMEVKTKVKTNMRMVTMIETKMMMRMRAKIVMKVKRMMERARKTTQTMTLKMHTATTKETEIRRAHFFTATSLD